MQDVDVSSGSTGLIEMIAADAQSNVTVLLAEMQNETNISDLYEKMLEEINRKEATLLAPIIIFLCLLMVVGVAGNSLVMYIYKFKFKRSNPRTFILCLAIVDNVTCCFGMPYHIVDMVHPYTFYNVAACKALSVIMTFTNMCSIFVLVVIAVDRYLKICKPFSFSISEFGTKKACIGVSVVALVLSWPNAILYGHSTQETNVQNITGVACFIDDSVLDTDYPVLYQGVCFLIFIVCTLTLCVLYTLVCRKIFRHNDLQIEGSRRSSSKRSYNMCMMSPTLSVTETSTSEAEEERPRLKSFSKSVELGASKTDSLRRCDKRDATDTRTASLRSTGTLSGRGGNTCPKHGLLRDPLSPKPLLGRSVILSLSENSASDEHPNLRPTVSSASTCTCSSNATTLSRRERSSRRITVMLFMITLIFVISFLPYLILMAVSSMDEHFWEDLTSAETVIYELLLRIYFINNMANPIIYTLWEMKFRREVKRLFSKLIPCVK